MSGPPLFIVACDRSGTTMLRLILDRGPDLAIPTESMILVDFANVRDRYGSLTTDAGFNRLAQDVWRHPKVREWGLSSGPPGRDGLVGEAAYRHALEAPFAAYAGERGKARWGDKTPLYIHHLGEVRRVFPEARIVVLVRDGRDVALSLLDVPFGPGNVWGAARMWRAAVEAGERAAAAWPESVLTVRYEDLVGTPEPVVREVCAFAGISYSPAMLAIEEAPAGSVAAGQEGWFRRLSEGISRDSVGRWRRQMPRDRVALFQAEAAAALARHGYPLDDAGTPPRIPAAAYAAHNWAVKGWQFGRLHIVQERGREVPQILRRHLKK
ncbi:MAG TPA: sulfotransferase [Gaiellales bacterium]|nr:sulfotransferase [Gaiellales bacterium]